MTLSRLSERDAWAIALAWREQLQGCVRLEIDSGTSAFRVVDTFEWVTFVFHGARDDGFADIVEPIDAARCARAASIAWFALSCCSGFSGRENPRFWKRVFSELHAPKGHQVIFRRPRAQIHITDAVRFFDNPAQPFPRVRMEPSVRDKEACIRAFLGYSIEPEPEDDPSLIDAMLAKLGQLLSFSRSRRRLSRAELDYRFEAHDARLRAILKDLSPFVRKAHWRRHLPVTIRGVAATDLAWMIPNLSFRPDHHGLVFEQLQLESVILRDDEAHAETAIRALLTKTHVNIVMPKVALSRFASSRNGLAGSLLRLETAATDARLQIGALTTVFPRGTTFVSLCSSLPHTRTISSVQLDVTSHHIATIIGLRAIEWAWLGYAIFHPDAQSDSVFAQLDLDQYRIIDREVESLERMAKGNNLVVDGHNASVLSSHYYQGRVRAATMVMASPYDDAAPIVTYASERWLTLLCVLPNHLKKWVGVVAPGYGLGWIRQEQIAETMARPPGPSCLRALRLNIESAFGGLGSLLRLLSIVGGGLEYLHIVGRRNPLDVAAVAAILRLCPALKSLRICHDGSFWSGIEESGSQLQELELVVGSYQHLPVLSPLNSPSLESLRALRVVTLAKTSFAANCETFVDVLARFPRLQYANWSLGWSHTGCSPLRSYHEHQAASQERFGVHADRIDAFAHLPMSISARLAFLSVVHHTKTNESALGSIGQDIAAVIFSFATTRMPRELYVDDEVEFVTGHYRN